MCKINLILAASFNLKITMGIETKELDSLTSTDRAQMTKQFKNKRLKEIMPSKAVNLKVNF